MRSSKLMAGLVGAAVAVFSGPTAAALGFLARLVFSSSRARWRLASRAEARRAGVLLAMEARGSDETKAVAVRDGDQAARRLATKSRVSFSSFGRARSSCTSSMQT